MIYQRQPDFLQPICSMSQQEITANLVDIFQKKVYPARIIITDGKISAIVRIDHPGPLPFALPGFVDAHVHIESSMLIPAEFARLAVVHGTVATVSDPHEIANVCGLAGVDFMIENGKSVPFKFNFGAPSCVPATVFETAGDALDSEAVEKLLTRDDILYLSEMMNFPGVLFNDEEVLKKIRAAIQMGKPVDGHAPGLRGADAQKYIDAGISTDHECFTREEAADKLARGMKILIREGSAAKNFEALIDLLNDHEDQMMFCSDDKHPDSLVAGHINQLCQRAVAKGISVFKVLKAACINPVFHYNLPVGLLRKGDSADFILVKELQTFEVLSTFIEGQKVAENGKTLININRKKLKEQINNFNCKERTAKDFIVKKGEAKSDVIEALDGQLITNRIKLDKEIFETDLENDYLKIVVVNRYKDSPVAKSFIKNFGFAKGAIASSVAHDSHNIVAVGVDDESICEAVNLVIKNQGGVSCVQDGTALVVPLPVAGLMSEDDGYSVARSYTMIDSMAKQLGSSLSAPFMTLSFMALLVIPHLKLSDRGLFDGDSFKFI